MCVSDSQPTTIGYCQGMNLLGATVLSIIGLGKEKEADAFWVFVCLVESRLGYYTKTMCGLEVDQKVLTAIFSSKVDKCTCC